MPTSPNKSARGEDRAREAWSIIPSSNECGVCSSTHAHAPRYTETGTRWDNRGRGKAEVPIFDGAWGRKCPMWDKTCPSLDIFTPSPVVPDKVRTPKLVRVGNKV